MTITIVHRLLSRCHQTLLDFSLADLIHDLINEVCVLAHLTNYNPRAFLDKACTTKIYSYRDYHILSNRREEC